MECRSGAARTRGTPAGLLCTVVPREARPGGHALAPRVYGAIARGASTGANPNPHPNPNRKPNPNQVLACFSSTIFWFLVTTFSDPGILPRNTEVRAARVRVRVGLGLGLGLGH